MVAVALPVAGAVTAAALAGMAGTAGTARWAGIMGTTGSPVFIIATISLVLAQPGRGGRAWYFRAGPGCADWSGGGAAGVPPVPESLLENSYGCDFAAAGWLTGEARVMMMITSQ